VADTSRSATPGQWASTTGDALGGRTGTTGNASGGQTNRTGDPLGQMTDQGQQAASSLADQARQQVSTRLNEQKERASGSLGTMAHAFRQTGQQLREQEQTGVAQFSDQAAQQIERFASYLQNREFADLVREVESFARRQPMLFLGAAFGLGFMTTRFLKSSGQPSGMGGGTMSRGASGGPLWRSMEVDVPVRVAYNQWTQFEEFPRFMEGVEEVRQLDEKRLHWKAQIAGKTEEWDAVISEQVPDQRIAWRSTTGAKNAGTVTFQPLGPNRTRISLHLDYQPEGVVEQVGSALGLVDRRIEGDLRRFKEFIESRGTATGAWRGEIHGERVQEPGRPL
jgi:hypothetical protein